MNGGTPWVKIPSKLPSDEVTDNWDKLVFPQSFNKVKFKLVSPSSFKQAEPDCKLIHWAEILKWINNKISIDSNRIMTRKKLINRLFI